MESQTKLGNPQGEAPRPLGRQTGRAISLAVVAETQWSVRAGRLGHRSG